MNQYIFAIDPGNTESGYALIQVPDFKLLQFGKTDNESLLKTLPDMIAGADAFAIEMVASYGMAVGKDVFETCVWIGRFIQAAQKEHTLIYRKDEKLCLCGSLKAKDSNIRQALIDRYATHDFKSGKGVKKNPDTFYGVSKDAWQAIAVGVTYYEKLKENSI
jgi:hypothetical protein